MKINLKKNNQGVSLIELIAAVAIFSFLILLATQIFKMAVDGQRGSISAQNVQENMRYAMEKMSKEIRMAQINPQGAGNCKTIITPVVDPDYKVFNTRDSDTKIYFKNKDGVCVAYYLESGRLKTKLGLGGGAPVDFVTPAKIEVSNLKFYVVDDLIGVFHTKQPYVTMVMDVKAIGPAMHEQKMKIQMTMSSRYYE